MTRIVKKSSERRAEIIQTARTLFFKQDYDKTTMQDFMTHLKIAKGTIYHYFTSKEELLEAVIEDIVHEHLEKMQILLQTINGNALQKIQALVEEGAKITDPSLLEKLHDRGNEAMHTRLLVAILMQQAPLYASLFHQGCEEGLFKTDAPLECAEFILAGLQFLTDVGIHPWKQEDLIRRYQAFPKLIEQLLQAPQGSFQFILTSSIGSIYE